MNSFSSNCIGLFIITSCQATRTVTGLFGDNLHEAAKVQSCTNVTMINYPFSSRHAPLISLRRLVVLPGPDLLTHFSGLFLLWILSFSSLCNIKRSLKNVPYPVSVRRKCCFRASEGDRMIRCAWSHLKAWPSCLWVPCEAFMRGKRLATWVGFFFASAAFTDVSRNPRSNTQPLAFFG